MDDDAHVLGDVRRVVLERAVGQAFELELAAPGHLRAPPGNAGLRDPQSASERGLGAEMLNGGVGTHAPRLGAPNAHVNRHPLHPRVHHSGMSTLAERAKQAVARSSRSVRGLKRLDGHLRLDPLVRHIPTP